MAKAERTIEINAPVETVWKVIVDYERYPEFLAEAKRLTVKKRTGKIFFDYNQNVRGKSLAAAYSPRRHPLATVSMPLTWDELETAYPTDFTMATAPDILESRSDPWGGILSARGDLGGQLARAG